MGWGTFRLPALVSTFPSPPSSLGLPPCLWDLTGGPLTPSSLCYDNRVVYLRLRRVESKHSDHDAPRQPPMAAETPPSLPLWPSWMLPQHRHHFLALNSTRLNSSLSPSHPILAWACLGHRVVACLMHQHAPASPLSSPVSDPHFYLTAGSFFPPAHSPNPTHLIGHSRPPDKTLPTMPHL